tara:strand:- start:448 stop:813 length:366 start_codon:yes stop_codon:yes gene_type:complete
MSLLSMSVYGVQMAGLGDPYDPGSDSVLETQKEVVRCFQPALENRTTLLADAGMSWEDAVQESLNSVQEDLLKHGEYRDVEVMILNLEYSNNSGIYTISGELGIGGSARYVTQVTATLDLN